MAQQAHKRRADQAVRPKTREDDVLECFLYPKFCYTSPDPDSITETQLIEEIQRYNEAISVYTNEYMWHRDALIFRPRTKQAMLLERVFENSMLVEDHQTVPHIYASLRFDEDIGDEWFTVFLVYKLTETFRGLIARLVDSDGEFLLIEAANTLPLWASPETCQDRVFIHDGTLHVAREKGKSFINLLKNIDQMPYNTRMSDKVQNALKKRLELYPEEITKRKHKARAFLPEKAASILSKEPGLIAPAIRMICHSDPLERKVCRAMRYFPPEQRTMVNVKMTKCLYALASHCRYTGDPRTGWNLPPASSTKYNAYALGVKIACGLEMLVARANEERRKMAKNVDGMQDEEKLKANEHSLNAFLSRLEANGYFRDLLEGSREREKLLTVAKDYFLKNFSFIDTSQYCYKTDAERVLEAWKNVQTNDVEMFAQDESTLSPADSDSWLNVDPVQLEALLNQQWGSGTKERRPENEPLSLREKVQAFLNQHSDVDGVQFSEDQTMEDGTRHDPDDNGRIEFDVDVFDNALRDILDLVVPGGEGEFEGSSEGSLGGDDEDKGGEMDKYMRLLDSELQTELAKEEKPMESEKSDTVEEHLTQSMQEEAGGSGPAGNIIGGPIKKLMHLQLQSPTATTVPPDLQS